jgi:hypothetical protein
MGCTRSASAAVPRPTALDSALLEVLAAAIASTGADDPLPVRAAREEIRRSLRRRAGENEFADALAMVASGCGGGDDAGPCADATLSRAHA